MDVFMSKNTLYSGNQRKTLFRLNYLPQYLILGIFVLDLDSI